MEFFNGSTRGIQYMKKYCKFCKSEKDVSEFFKRCNYCRFCYSNHNSFLEAKARKNSKRRNLFNTNIREYINKHLTSVKSKTFSRNLTFNIDVDFMMQMWDKQNGRCFYTNRLMYKDSSGKPNIQSPSIDRLDASKGYEKGNVVWCCLDVNRFKFTLNIDEFKEIISDIKWIKPSEPEYYI